MAPKATFVLQTRRQESDSWHQHMASDSSAKVSREATRLAPIIPFLRIRVPNVEHNVAEWARGARLERIPLHRVCRRCWFRTTQRHSMCAGCNAGRPAPTSFAEYSIVEDRPAPPVPRVKHVEVPLLAPRRPKRVAKPRRVVMLLPPGEKNLVAFEVMFDGAYCE